MIAAPITFSYLTVDGWLPDAMMNIHFKNIAGGKHGSDCEAYDHDGSVVESEFGHIFAAFDKDGKSALSGRELMHMLTHKKHLFDMFGRTTRSASWGELCFLVFPTVGRAALQTPSNVASATVRHRHMPACNRSQSPAIPRQAAYLGSSMAVDSSDPRLHKQHMLIRRDDAVEVTFMLRYTPHTPEKRCTVVIQRIVGVTHLAIAFDMTATVEDLNMLCNTAMHRLGCKYHHLMCC